MVLATVTRWAVLARVGVVRFSIRQHRFRHGLGSGLMCAFHQSACGLKRRGDRGFQHDVISSLDGGGSQLIWRAISPSSFNGQITVFSIACWRLSLVATLMFCRQTPYLYRYDYLVHCTPYFDLLEIIVRPVMNIPVETFLGWVRWN